MFGPHVVPLYCCTRLWATVGIYGVRTSCQSPIVAVELSVPVEASAPLQHFSEHQQPYVLAHGNHARIRPHRPFYMNANMTPSNTLCHWQVCSAGVRTQIGRGLPRVCMFDWVAIGRCDCFMCVLWWSSYVLQMLFATGTCIMHDGGSTWGAHVYAMGTC